MKCVAINIGLLNAEGVIDEQLVLRFVDEWVPLKYHDHAAEVMADCMHHAGSLDPKEPTCKSYDPIFKCVTESATKFAKVLVQYLLTYKIQYNRHHQFHF